MARIFISHSSKNNPEAKAFVEWRGRAGRHWLQISPFSDTTRPLTVIGSLRRAQIPAPRPRAIMNRSGQPGRRVFQPVCEVWSGIQKKLLGNCSL